jgi:prepilin-type N-terminal cleavage/methylation domain-containing protein
MRDRGFSLIELMIVVVIMGIALGVSMPAFLRFADTLSIRQVRAQVVQDLRLARQTAITRHSPVIVAFGDGISTTNVGDYTIHVDTNGDCAVQSGERRYYRALPRRTLIGTVALDPRDSVVFDPSGVLRLNTTGGQLAFVSQRGRRDTLLVSAAGVVYRP